MKPNAKLDSDESHKDYRGDFAIEDRETGQLQIIDVTIAVPTANTYNNCCAEVGDAADKTESVKLKKYNSFICKDSSQQCSLFIFAVENNGGLAKNAKKFCRRIAKLSEDPVYSLHQLYSEINVTIQKIRYDQMFEIDKHFSKSSNCVSLLS